MPPPPPPPPPLPLCPQITPSVAELVLERTGLLKWLLTRVRKRGSDSNRLYASELLAILMQVRLGGRGVGPAVTVRLLCRRTGPPARGPTTPRACPVPGFASGAAPPTPLLPCQGHEANQRRLGEADGVDALLLSINPYKSRDPQARGPLLGGGLRGRAGAGAAASQGAFGTPTPKSASLPC
jgi:hypothetical protein